MAERREMAVGKKSSKKARRAGRNQPQTMRWAVLAAVVLVGLIIGAQWWNHQQTVNVIQAASYYDQFPSEGNRIGAPDAVVHVEEYFDFQCPHCQTASQQVVKRLLDEYVAEGKVSFSYKFFPILGPESVLAAQAAFCAMEMDAFWPYQEVLFAKKGLGNNGTYSRNNLIDYARQLGLDGRAFQECLDGDRSLQYVQQQYNQAVRMGLVGTPTFFVNGQAVPISTWEDVFHAVDRALAAAGR